MKGETSCFLQKEESIAWINLSRPPVNALSRPLVRQLDSCLDQLEAEEGCAGVFVRSRVDRNFSAGADLKERKNMDQQEVKEFVQSLRSTFDRLASLPTPTVAVINGPALGGGLELALACDLRIASDQAEFALPEVRLGLIPGAGGTQRLPQIVGPGTAREIIFTARRYSAREGYEIGLYNQLHSPKNLLDEARKMGRLFTDNSVPAMRLAKQSLDRGIETDLKQGLEFEWEYYLETFDYNDRRQSLEDFGTTND